MVFLFNKNIKNTLSNCIFHDDDRDPLWINDNIKQLIQEKNDTYRNYILNNKNPQIFNKIKHLQKQLKNLIERSQEKYYCSVLKILISYINISFFRVTKCGRFHTELVLK